MLEEPYPEHIEQQSARRLLEALAGTLLPLRLRPHVVGCQHRAYLIVAPILVYTRLQDLVVALCLRQRLHAPRLAAHRTVEHFHILRDGPVCADDALKLSLLAQLLLDEPLAVTATHVLTRRILVPQDAVDRHHGRSHLCTALQFEGTVDERQLVLRQIVAGIDGILARGKVGVAPTFLRSVAIPVFHHRIDASHPPSARIRRCLEGIAIGPCHLCGQQRVFAKGAAKARPPWIRGDIHLRRQGCGDAQRPVLLRGNLAEAVHQLRIEGSRQSERGRPL